MLRRTWLYCAAFTLLMLPLAAGAADSKDTFTDPEKAGVDFTLQGEYVGNVKGENGEEKWGAQVIALGNGKFHAVGFKGGLPGDGWKRGDEKHEADGELKDGVVTFKKDDMVLTIKDGGFHVVAGDKELGTLKKVERKSPTLGAKPPEGAIVLFDGTTAEKWNNGKMTEDKLLMATNPESKEKFGDHTFHLEFRTPFMPTARGQGRGNSGVYLQSRYELQVLDSFGLEGANNECGGIYTIAVPAVNACFPPLAWQTYDVEFKAAKYDDQGKKIQNARATIKHNGIVIHENLDLKNGTPGRHGEGPGPDAIYLQDHGNPVVYRNIWVVKQ